MSEVVLPQTGRKLCLRTVQPADLLRAGDCPDILTTILLKNLYGDTEDGKRNDSSQDALVFVHMLDRIATKMLPDDVCIHDLTLAEKRHLYNLALSPTFALASFAQNRRQLWLLWRKSTSFHRLPSEIFGECDPLAAYQIDNVVLTFGTIVENMLLERDEIGSGQNKTSVARYTITQLLDPDFLYPRPEQESNEDFSMPVEGLIFDEVK